MTNSIFNEASVAKSIIENGFSGKNIAKREMIFVAKHYMWTLGYGSAKTKTELIKFCNENSDNFNVITNSNLVNDAVRIAKKDRFKKISSVQITIKEIKQIKSVRNFEYQKILFALLVFAKALKFTFTKTNKKASNRVPIGYYVSNSLISKIKKTAGTRISKKNFLYIFNYFFEKGLVEPTYFNSIRIMFVEEKGRPTIIVNNFNDIVGFYIRYCGGELYYCSNCGSENKKIGNKKDLCDDCMAEKRKKDVRKSVARLRRGHKK